MPAETIAPPVECAACSHPVAWHRAGLPMRRELPLPPEHEAERERLCTACLPEFSALEQTRRASEAWPDYLTTRLPAELDEAMGRIGFPRRQWRPARELINREIARAIGEVAKEFPLRGFGLGGPSGCGKSCLFAYLVRGRLERSIAEAGPARFRSEGGTVFSVPPGSSGRPRFILVDWPARARAMKTAVAAGDWTGAASLDALRAELVARPSTVVILDDLGAERVRSENGADWALEQLDALVDWHYGNERPLFYTTMLREAEFPRFYGARTASRLLATAPLFQFPPAADLRRTR